MTPEQKVFRLESLRCENNAISAELAAMMTLNAERTVNGYPPAYTDAQLFEKAADFRELARKFKELEEL